MAEPKKPTKTNPDGTKQKKAKAAPAPAAKGEAAEPAPQSQVASTEAAASASAAETSQAAAKVAKKPAKAHKEEPAAAQAPPSLSLDGDDIEKPKVVKAKGSKNVHSGIAHVLSTFNNTIVTI